MNTEIGVSGGTPTDGNTITLFDNFVAFKGTILAALDISRIQFSVENDQAGTLRGYMSKDGTTYYQVGGDIAVGIAPATDISGPYDFVVDPYRYFRLTWQNGGVTQTLWVPTLTAIASDRALGA